MYDGMKQSFYVQIQFLTILEAQLHTTGSGKYAVRASHLETYERAKGKSSEMHPESSLIGLEPALVAHSPSVGKARHSKSVCVG